MKEKILKTLDVLHNGGIILYPTDTVWGIGCCATDADAIDKLYKIKQRDKSKSFLILLDHVSQVQAYVNKPSEVALDIMNLSEDPLTVIFESAKNLPKNLIAEDGSIAIRIVNDPFCKALIGKLKRPIVSTSANFTGEPTPLYFKEIDRKLIAMVDYTVKLKQNVRHKKSSSIIKISRNNEIKIIRK
jgi:L-threonylcarbamoyladenylate synthase